MDSYKHGFQTAIKEFRRIFESRLESKHDELKQSIPLLKTALQSLEIKIFKDLLRVKNRAFNASGILINRQLSKCFSGSVPKSLVPLVVIWKHRNGCST